MATEKIKCGKCGAENWVDPFKTTACKKCGAPIQGTKARIERTEYDGGGYLSGYVGLCCSLIFPLSRA